MLHCKDIHTSQPYKIICNLQQAQSGVCFSSIVKALYYMPVKYHLSSVMRVDTRQTHAAVSLYCEYQDEQLSSVTIILHIAVTRSHRTRHIRPYPAPNTKAPQSHGTGTTHTLTFNTTLIDSSDVFPGFVPALNPSVYLIVCI